MSRKLVLNKSFDLIEKKNPKECKQIKKKTAQALSSLKAEWKEKIKVMEMEAFSYKKNVNRHIESIKYKPSS